MSKAQKYISNIETDLLKEFYSMYFGMYYGDEMMNPDGFVKNVFGHSIKLIRDELVRRGFEESVIKIEEAIEVKMLAYGSDNIGKIGDEMLESIRKYFE